MGESEREREKEIDGDRRWGWWRVVFNIGERCREKKGKAKVKTVLGSKVGSFVRWSWMVDT